MNIGFDFRMGGTLHAGIGRYGFELLKAMLEIDRHDTFYVFYNESVARANLDELDQSINVELVRVAARHYSIAEQTTFLRVLNNTPVDVMFFPNFNHPMRYKKSFVVTIHDMVHHRISGHKKSRWLWFKAYKLEMEHAVRGSKAIVAPSEAAKADIVHYFPDAADKISVVYEGAFLQEQPEELVAKVKRQFLLSRPYFLFVGTLERKKNIVGLARGFDVLLEKYKLDVDLVYAGKVDAHYPDEKFKALEIKHKDHLIFTGYVEDDVLAALYQGAHAYVNASLNEGFGLPGVEAMRFGLPLAVANTPVFNEVYDNAAMYFDAQNADDIAEQLRLLAVDRQYYEHKQEMAISRSQFFDWWKAAQKTLEVLRAASGKPADVPIAAEFVADV